MNSGVYDSSKECDRTNLKAWTYVLRGKRIVIECGSESSVHQKSSVLEFNNCLRPYPLFAELKTISMGTGYSVLKSKRYLLLAITITVAIVDVLDRQ